MDLRSWTEQRQNKILIGKWNRGKKKAMKSRKVYDLKKKKKNDITRIRNTSIVQTIRCSCFYSIAGEDDHQDDHMLTI